MPRAFVIVGEADRRIALFKCQGRRTPAADQSSRSRQCFAKRKSPGAIGALSWFGLAGLALHHRRAWTAFTTGARGRANHHPNADGRSKRSAGRANMDTRRNTGKDARIEDRNSRNSRYRSNRAAGRNRVARSRPVAGPKEAQRRGAPAGRARNRPRSLRSAIRPGSHTWLVHI
jgi:hypothetical protein